MLDVRRQRADVVDAGDVEQLADLLETDLGLAARDDLPTGTPGEDLLELRLDLVGDAHALEQAGEIDAARSGGTGDRFGRQQRLSSVRRPS